MNENAFSQNILFGKIVTGEEFIDNRGRSEIISKFNPLCVDMETASIAHVCYVNKIPFISIRSITDTEDERSVEVFEYNCLMAAKKSIDFVKKLLLRI
ncbi:5'-methylthioadenosine/S-adenosylhomocysteine nucleosidase [Clostridium sp.]|uniref:5'-methylthioadenosine/S-adenosylhomocysteine nucleosidase n=1 Tax=Clostridium sp. TaxID=1506 RepID=UPI00290A692D|nr:5'-methylthioadenosine/S-adenosylhomocysteine nucleosidase [Clostridium sp.]MDU4739693.1 5'-methylthioadenosine/S-adenosylhomocysteine nucleosidase [Clostridium sp.]